MTGRHTGWYSDTFQPDTVMGAFRGRRVFTTGTGVGAEGIAGYPPSSGTVRPATLAGFGRDGYGRRLARPPRERGSRTAPGAGPSPRRERGTRCVFAPTGWSTDPRSSDERGATSRSSSRRPVHHLISRNAIYRTGTEQLPYGDSIRRRRRESGRLAGACDESGQSAYSRTEPNDPPRTAAASAPTSTSSGTSRGYLRRK